MIIMKLDLHDCAGVVDGYRSSAIPMAMPVAVKDWGRWAVRVSAAPWLPFRFG